MNNEKVSVNINDDKLAKMDLLINEGFFSNRSAFINEAIDILLNQRSDLINNLIQINTISYNPNMWFIGIQNLSKNYLEGCKQQSIKLKIKGFGILYLDNNITLELFKETVDEISQKINLRGNKELIDFIKNHK